MALLLPSLPHGAARAAVPTIGRRATIKKKAVVFGLARLPVVARDINRSSISLWAKALPNFLRGAGRLASLEERQVVIIAWGASLPASAHRFDNTPLTCTAHLTGGLRAHRSFHFNPSDHVSILHNGTVSRCI